MEQTLKIDRQTKTFVSYDKRVPAKLKAILFKKAIRSAPFYEYETVTGNLTVKADTYKMRRITDCPGISMEERR